MFVRIVPDRGKTGIRRPGADATLLLVVNAHHDMVNFRLPPVPEGEFWTCMLDTNEPAAPSATPSAS